MIRQEPFACTWLQREDRAQRLRLVANTGYWDKARGPHLQEIVSRNDLAPERALDLVCDAEGEVDILTEIGPADAARVEASEHAKLVAVENTPRAGSSSGRGFSLPEVMISSMGGHRSRISAASFMPSMPRGLSLGLVLGGVRSEAALTFDRKRVSSEVC